MADRLGEREDELDPCDLQALSVAVTTLVFSVVFGDLLDFALSVARGMDAVNLAVAMLLRVSPGIGAYCCGGDAYCGGRLHDGCCM